MKMISQRRVFCALIFLLVLSSGAQGATIYLVTGGQNQERLNSGTGGTSSYPIYESGVGPTYAGTWGAAASYSGMITLDSGSITGTLSWIGESGYAPAGQTEFFTSSINSGGYDLATGIASGAYACWNNPTAVTALAADFCGNGTGGGAGGTPLDITFMNLSAGLWSLTDQGDGTVTLTYTENPDFDEGDPSDTNFVSTWLLDTTVVPIPAAIWLFGSALGLLGWMRRKAS
jgi:hypothetical protein